MLSESSDLLTSIAHSGGCKEYTMSQEEDLSPKEFRGRFDPVLHQKIKSAAKDSFRSMSAEIVYRLTRSFEHDEKVEATTA
jgi:hypothetical protein